MIPPRLVPYRGAALREIDVEADPGLLLREAMRLAAQFNAPWHAVHVLTPHEASTENDRGDQRRIADALEVAQKMGGTAVVLKNKEVGEALISFSQEYGVAHMVMGRPAKNRLSHWRFRPSLLEVLTRELADVNFVIV
jgi:two-component system sensor histidine kinase KdpD